MYMMEGKEDPFGYSEKVCKKTYNLPKTSYVAERNVVFCRPVLFIKLTLKILVAVRQILMDC